MRSEFALTQLLTLMVDPARREDWPDDAKALLAEAEALIEPKGEKLIDPPPSP